MELIIKPTGRCNFNCTFCSSAYLDIAHPTRVPDKIKDLIEKMKPSNIIVTGGEPLTIDPSYYLELQEIARCHIGFTSNMKDFFMHPDKWAPIACNPNFGFITSFNYGDTRRWDENTPYTEEKFYEVFKLFQQVTGKSLPFIAVIDESNEDMIMDHVYLAKRLGTIVKINGACKIGKQGVNYPKYKLIQAYIKIIDEGLDEFEMTCAERHLGKCSFNTKLLCHSTIRCCYVDTAGELHYGICDDLISAGKEIPMDEEFPVSIAVERPSRAELIDTKCELCELYRFCNGCEAHRENAKDFPEYCDKMRELLPDLERQGWFM